MKETNLKKKKQQQQANTVKYKVFYFVCVLAREKYAKLRAKIDKDETNQREHIGKKTLAFNLYLTESRGRGPGFPVSLNRGSFGHTHMHTLFCSPYLKRICHSICV